MNVFIVFAHNLAPNGALKDLAVLTLKKKRSEVIVSDLYGMGFKINIIKKMQWGCGAILLLIWGIFWCSTILYKLN